MISRALVSVGAGVQLPVVGELSDDVAMAIADGQPLVLMWRGWPAGVLVDVDSYLGGRSFEVLELSDGSGGVGQDGAGLTRSSGRLTPLGGPGVS